MRIVIDLQGAQTPKAISSGISKQVIDFVRELIKDRKEHDIVLVLNAMLTDSLEQTRKAFADLLPNEKIASWHAVGPVQQIAPSSAWHRKSAELIRASFLKRLNPDVLLLTTLFAGWHDEAVTGIGQSNLDLLTVILKECPLDYSLQEKNPDFRIWQQNKQHQLEKAWFSLDIASCEIAAKNFWNSIEQNQAQLARPPILLPTHRPRLAYVSSIIPEKNILAELAQFYEIEIISLQTQSDHFWISQNCTLRSFEWFLKHSHEYQRVLYHFWNHSQITLILNLIEQVSGVVLLEEFYLSNLFSHPNQFDVKSAAWTKALYDSHGYGAINENLVDQKFAKKYPANFALQRFSLGIISFKEAKELALKWYGPTTEHKWFILEDPSTAQNYATAIEHFYAKEVSLSQLINQIARLDKKNISHTKMRDMAIAIAQSIPRPNPALQLFVDISTIVQEDSKTGIQRVVRALLLELIKAPPPGFRIEPVYLTNKGKFWHYRYARCYTLKLLKSNLSESSDNIFSEECFTDDEIEVQPGDVAVLLDLTLNQVIETEKCAYFDHLKKIGIRFWFTVFDLLPLLSLGFSHELKKSFKNWLQAVTRFSDGAICISHAVSEELKKWLQDNEPSKLISLKIKHFHLGADIKNSAPSLGIPEDSQNILKMISQRPTFIMVGTIEPRKGHLQVLKAFETLWSLKTEINLIIIGKSGWMMESFVRELQNHPKLDQYLFWMDRISDEYLEILYSKANCLIAASEGEGFGLPLIEAARHKIPLLIRDLPVFREVAGNHATYFTGLRPDELANAVTKWLKQYKDGNIPQTAQMPWLTWEQSKQQFVNALFS